MQTLNEDIKKREFKPVYLLWGEEEFLKRSYKTVCGKPLPAGTP